jgi:hypothetical protein
MTHKAIDIEAYEDVTFYEYWYELKGMKEVENDVVDGVRNAFCLLSEDVSFRYYV